MNLRSAYLFQSFPPNNKHEFNLIARLDGPLGAMTAVAFLLYQPSHEGRSSGVRDFLKSTMARLLPQLNRTTQVQRKELRGQTTGHIDWANTYKVRLSSSNDPTTFMCKENQRLYNRPENLLLKFLLQQIQRCMDQIPGDLQNWLIWRSTLDDSRVPIRVELAQYANLLRKYQSNIYGSSEFSRLSQ